MRGSLDNKLLRSSFTILSLSLLVFGISSFTGCTKKAKMGDCPKGVADATKLQMEDLKVGDGAEAVAGKIVSVHYTGWLTDCKKFDSSRDRNQEFRFPLGDGRVIKGWDQGVAGMKVGGVRRLIIPADMGYGAQGAGHVIPPNATLIFDVELKAVKE